MSNKTILFVTSYESETDISRCHEGVHKHILNCRIIWHHHYYYYLVMDSKGSNVRINFHVDHHAFQYESLFGFCCLKYQS